MYFNFGFCSFSWYFYRNYEFCSRITLRKKKKQDKIVLLVKSKLNSIEFLISKTLIDSNINHNIFVLISNVLKKYDNIKEEIKNLKT